MSACLDHGLMDTPLVRLPPVEMPLAVMLKQRLGLLSEVEEAGAAMVGFAHFLSRQDGHGLVAFINAMAESAPTGRRMNCRAVSVGTIPNQDDETDRLLVVLGEDGEPVETADGHVMMFSVGAINRLAASALAGSGRSDWRGALHGCPPYNG